MARKKTAEEKEFGVLLANVRELLKTRYGKDVIWYILSLTNLGSDSFTGNSQTFYNEGKRAVGLQLVQLLDEADPTAYARLMLDQIKPEVNDDGSEPADDGTYTDTDNGTDADN